MSTYPVKQLRRIPKISSAKMSKLRAGVLAAVASIIDCDINEYPERLYCELIRPDDVQARTAALLSRKFFKTTQNP